MTAVARADALRIDARSARRVHARADDTRRRILQASLSCFAEIGFDRTTLSDIRLRSRASIGSIYHHFGSKEGLAASLYIEGVEDYQAGFLEELERRRSPRRGIEAIVRFHLGWIEEHPPWARFLFQMRHVEAVADYEDVIQQRNRRFFERIGAWFRPHVAAGRLRALPFDVYSAVLLGPCQDYARQWLAGRVQTPLRAAAEMLVETTWRAVRSPQEE